MDITVSAIEQDLEITLPMGIYEDNKDNFTVGFGRRTKYGAEGQIIGGYCLQYCLYAGPATEVWLSSNDIKEAVIVKLFKRRIHSEIINKINSWECRYFVPILEFGIADDINYEVMPYLKKGFLRGPLDEETIKMKVMPGLTEALKILHENQLVHNDIKPENIFWDSKKEYVLLGDFDSVASAGEKPEEYSLAYAAPEVVLGKPATALSDWTSVALTLGSLLKGQKLIPAVKKTEVFRWWEKGYVFHEGSNEFNKLINGMLQIDTKKRYSISSATAWIRGDWFGRDAERRVKKTVEIKKIVLYFENPTFRVKNIKDMLLAMEHYWEHFIFLLEHGKIEDFLQSIDEEAYATCLSLKKECSLEQAAMMMSYYFSSGRYFIWRGHLYENMSEMEETWDIDSEAIIDFLLSGAVFKIMQEKKADKEAVEYVKELVIEGRINPEKACMLFFRAFNIRESFRWNGEEFSNVEELVDYLCRDSKTVDDVVNELLDNSRFLAWMSFEGYGDLMETILRGCTLQ